MTHPTRISNSVDHRGPGLEGGGRIGRPIPSPTVHASSFFFFFIVVVVVVVAVTTFRS
jgi:hypothetical protein